MQLKEFGSVDLVYVHDKGLSIKMGQQDFTLTIHTFVCFNMGKIRRSIMHAENVRLNVILPRDVVESLNDIAGPRNRSRVISESIREYLRQRKNAELVKKLEEGYRASAKENIDLAGEFEAVDLEDWDEY